MSKSTAIPDCLAAISARIDGEVRSDTYTRVLYSTDASIYQAMPLGVVIPRSAGDVHATLEAAVEHGVPVLARTSGTSLAGQAVNEALVIDMSRHLDGVLDFDREAKRVRVEPGIVLDELNRQLGAEGLQFGPDPASSDRAALGGIVSNNSTGAHSILYGMTADHVEEMGVILADGSQARFAAVEADAMASRMQLPGREGEIYRAVSALVGEPGNRDSILSGTPRHWRRCGGYNLDRFIEGASFRVPRDSRFNLAKLVCGAEGGLAVMTDITLGLVEVPAEKGLALLHFSSLRGALSAVPAILEQGPSAVELLDHMGLELCRGVPEYARLLETFVEGDPNCILICEFHGQSRSELEAGIERLAGAVRREMVGASAVSPILDPARQADVWTVRKVGLGLLMSIRGDLKPLPFIEDAAVPVEHLADYVDEVERFCRGLGTRVAYYAHASAGCLHIRPLIDAKLAGEIAKMPEILAFSVELLHGNGGSLSSEHGDGRARSWINERFFGPELYDLYRQVKRIFDPEALLNPGTVVEAPAMTESLRYGEEYRVVAHAPQLDFSAEQGFDRAVEMCNGAGVCRRLTHGTMCPSFMVTRDEEHSTRGRANMLRAAMSGTLPAEELTSRRMYEVMELCVECKACKAECPSSVDMAKIKVEFLAGYHARHGVPLRDRLFGSIDRISRMSSGAMAPVANALLGNRVVRWVMEKTLGLDRRRTLPRFARVPFTRWFESRVPTPAGCRRVVLFNDTFNTYSTPEVAQAASEFLEAAGFEVVLPGHRCCGRPMLSKGLVEPARALALETLDRLAPLAAEGVPIVGLEPSCLLTLRDEYRYLLPNDPRVETVAAAAETFEEFVAREAAAGTLGVEFTTEAAEVLLHGHCHQKALVGTGPALQALSLPRGYRVREVDSGCCGMAGSFGYESEHYDISMAMAERRLLPAVRDQDGEAVVAAAGTSCRHQIEHGAERAPLHPAQILNAALVK
jgi:FAD/FMN-containing dehydrogenase/Fe-S oxidoreductase